MIELLLAPQNLPFAVALSLMLGIAVLEGVLLLLGSGFMDAFDSLLPDLPETDVAVDPNVEAGGFALSKFLGWLYVGKVPALMLLVVFLTGFGVIGLVLQTSVHGLLGFYLPRVVAAGAATFLALPFVRGAGALLARLMPGNESEATSTASFIGRRAVITLGTATEGAPAEARLTDANGQDHYIMLEPEHSADRFAAGQAVIVTAQEGATYKGVPDAP